MKAPTDQFFYGHGKLLLSGEYFVTQGATALALPTKLGQSLSVRYQPSTEPKLNWRSFDSKNNIWFEVDVELWRFDILNSDNDDVSLTLQQILRQVRKQNPHFLRDNQDVYVETRIEFPLNWGLGSSSTLLYNIAQWAYVSPFELGEQTLGGSGYDIACAQSYKPIFYHKIDGIPEWSEAAFNPMFSNNLYFLHLNNKQDTQSELKHFKNLKIDNKTEILKELSELAKAMVEVDYLSSFQSLMKYHEDLIAKALGYGKVQDQYFSDFQGQIKSLGAWGGDFCLVASDMSYEKLKSYFSHKGFSEIIKYDDLVKKNESYLQNRDSHLVRTSL